MGYLEKLEEKVGGGRKAALPEMEEKLVFELRVAEQNILESQGSVCAEACMLLNSLGT